MSQFVIGQKVRTKPHSRYWDITTNGHAQLTELQETKIKGGREGVISNLLNDGMGGYTVEVRHSQNDFGEYNPDELELI